MNINISAVGDVGIIGKISQQMSINGFEYPFSKVKHLLSESDINFCNLEIPFSESESKPVSGEISPYLKSNGEGVFALKAGGFNIVSLANNHIMDYGKSGLEYTVRLLKENNIGYTGAGKNLEESRIPAIIEIKEHRLALLAYAQVGPHSASPSKAGAAPLFKEYITNDLLLLKDRVDWIIVSLHFGMIYTDYPRKVDQILARELIDSGANIILGHHPHVIQGIEEYHDGLIFYSLGEFIFDPTLGNVQAKHIQEIRKETFIAQIIIENFKLKSNLIPVYIGEDYCPKLATSDILQRISQRIENISRPLENYDIDFEKHVASRTVGHNFKIMLYNLFHLNFNYFFSRMRKIRLIHVKIFLRYFSNVIKKLKHNDEKNGL